MMLYSLFLYLVVPLLAALTIFLILIGFESINQIWFSFIWKNYYYSISEAYYRPLRKKLFEGIDELKSSDPELLREKAIRILEIGPGIGPNFMHYPKCRLITVDKNANFRNTLLNNARKFSNITVENAFVCRGENIKDIVEDGYCDVVVLTHVMCSAFDHIAVLNEAYRALKKGGTLYTLEHLGYRAGLSLKIQQILNPLWVYIFCGCYITRDITDKTYRDAGFVDVAVDYIEMNNFSGIFWLLRPNIIGKASK